MPDEDMRFLKVTNLDDLTPEEHDRYQVYWFSKTAAERLKEVMRLNIAKWGKEVFEKGMDKTHFEVISLSDYRENATLR